MSQKTHEQKPGTILMLAKGAILSVRVRDTKTTTCKGARFVNVELLHDLYLNYEKRKHAFLEDCPCHISELNQDATSVNHAYTLISTEFEVDRQAKGGNVFLKVYYPNHSGELLPLQSLRAAKLATLPKKNSSDASRENDSDLSAVAHILTGVLYNEVLFVRLIQDMIEKCERATGAKRIGTKRKAGDLFPFYQHVFGQFRNSLLLLDISNLITRWSGRLDQFLHGAWSGYFLDEMDCLMSQDPAFAELVVQASYLRSGDAGIKELNNWIHNEYQPFEGSSHPSESE